METKNINIREDKLFRINKGYNFFNLEQKEKKYFIEVMLETYLNLKEKTETIRIETNLPTNASWRNLRSLEVIDFLNELEEFVKKPLVKIRNFNRKNKLQSYEIGGLKDKFRDKTLKFEDINITIGELAEKKLKAIGIDNFKKKVKEILNLQKTADNKIQELVDRFVKLKEKMLILNELVKDNEYYGYRENRDDTIKIKLTPLEYNKKLKKVETEIKEIAEKLGIEVRDYDFKYLPIERKVSYDEWLEHNKVELEDNFNRYCSEYGDDEEKPYENFEQYAKEMFDECGGTITETWKG